MEKNPYPDMPSWPAGLRTKLPPGMTAIQFWEKYRNSGLTHQQIADKYGMYRQTVEAAFTFAEKESERKQRLRLGSEEHSNHVIRVLIQLMGPYSVRVFADEVGVHYSRLYRVMKGKRPLNIDDAVKIARFRGVPLDIFAPPLPVTYDPLTNPLNLV